MEINMHESKEIIYHPILDQDTGDIIGKSKIITLQKCSNVDKFIVNSVLIYDPSYLLEFNKNIKDGSLKVSEYFEELELRKSEVPNVFINYRSVLDKDNNTIIGKTKVTSCVLSENANGYIIDGHLVVSVGSVCKLLKALEDNPELPEYDNWLVRS